MAKLYRPRQQRPDASLRKALNELKAVLDEREELFRRLAERVGKDAGAGDYFSSSPGLTPVPAGTQSPEQGVFRPPRRRRKDYGGSHGGGGAETMPPDVRPPAERRGGFLRVQQDEVADGSGRHVIVVDLALDGALVMRHQFFGEDEAEAEDMLLAHRGADAELDAALDGKPYDGIEFEVVGKNDDVRTPGTFHTIDMLEDGKVIVRHQFFGDTDEEATAAEHAHRKADESLDDALQGVPYHGIDIEAERHAASFKDENGNVSGGGAGDADSMGMHDRAHTWRDSRGGTIYEALLKYITHRNGKWLVHSESGKLLGTHDSKEDAIAQLGAIESHKKAKRHQSQSKATRSRPRTIVTRDCRRTWASMTAL